MIINMVLATHIIFTGYGVWLPNDPRGSWSDFVREWELFKFGPPTKTEERRSLAHVPHNRDLRRAAKKALKYKPVKFNGNQALAVANGFAKAARESGYIVVACSIMPDHVHMVVLRHERLAERIIGHMKARATQQLLEEGLHPFSAFRDAQDRVPSVWAHRGWKVFLNSIDDILRTIKYVENNPLREGKKKQNWKFVKRFSVELLEETLRERSR
jgi:REP element-mobilizing transposase RayT